MDTLNGVKEWKYPFSLDKIHFFTINKSFKVNENTVFSAILKNRVFIIGGVVVGSNKMWLIFSSLVYECQKKLLLNGMVDDDQGVFMMTLLEDEGNIQLNYLGKNKWFNLFKLFNEASAQSFLVKIKNSLRLK